MKRRQFLVLSAASIGGVLVYSLDRKVYRLAAQDNPLQTPNTKQKQVRVPLRFFTESEALLIAAAAARIMPSDETGPGAQEAGVVIFIDRQLAGPWGRDRYRYAAEPFEDDVAPEFGYQGKAAPRDVYREGLKLLAGFDQLMPAQQDEKLRQIENTTFFRLLRQNTIEGMFSDPLHGGNIDMVGWQLIGFPGPRMSNFVEVDKYRGQAFRPKPVSLRDVGGASYKPLEDET